MAISAIDVISLMGSSPYHDAQDLHATGTHAAKIRQTVNTYTVYAGRRSDAIPLSDRIPNPQDSNRDPRATDIPES